MTCKITRYSEEGPSKSDIEGLVDIVKDIVKISDEIGHKIINDLIGIKDPREVEMIEVKDKNYISIDDLWKYVKKILNKED